MKCFLIKSQPARNVGRERRGAYSGSVYYVLTALFIVKVNDMIPLRMVMRQFNKHSINQVVYRADERLQTCCTCHVTQLMLPWSECVLSPATFSTPGRGEEAEGSMGSKNQEGYSFLRGLDPKPGKAMAPSWSAVLVHRTSWSPESPGTGRHLCSWLLPAQSHVN